MDRHSFEVLIRIRIQKTASVLFKAVLRIQIRMFGASRIRIHYYTDTNPYKMSRIRMTDFNALYIRIFAHVSVGYKTLLNNVSPLPRRG